MIWRKITPTRLSGIEIFSLFINKQTLNNIQFFITNNYDSLTFVWMRSKSYWRSLTCSYYDNYYLVVWAVEPTNYYWNYYWTANGSKYKQYFISLLLLLLNNSRVRFFVKLIIRNKFINIFHLLWMNEQIILIWSQITR